MRHPVLFVLTVLACATAWMLGTGWFLLLVALAVVCGLLTLTLGLCLVAAGAEDDYARSLDTDLHEPKDL